MGTNCAPLVADLFYTATKEISWILLSMTVELISSKPLIRLLSTWVDNPYFEGIAN